MKTKPKPTLIYLAVLSLGVIALALRLWLYASGVDEKGLFVSGHPCAAGVWVVCAAALALTLAASRKETGNPASWEEKPSLPAAAGCAVMAVAMALGALTGGKPASALETAEVLLGFLSGACLAVAALYRYRGHLTPFWMYGVTCVCFAIRAICRYRLWCGDPQLNNYLFDMLATLFLMLFSYMQTANAVGMGSCRGFVATGLLSCFFCCGALPGSTQVPVLIGGLVWTVTALFSLENRCQDTGENGKE